MTTEITNPVRSDVPTDDAAAQQAPAPSARWALAGLAAGVTGAAAIYASLRVDVAYQDADTMSAVELIAAYRDHVPWMVAFHVLAVVCAALMLVFAVGLFRRLRASEAADSLVPGVAAAGVAATALVLFIGAGLDTEFVWGFAQDDVYVDPSNALFYNHWVATISWCWGLLGLSGLALFAAARTGGVARWLGLVGLLGGGLTLLVGISPVQYMAGFTGPVGLVVVALGFLVGDRVDREQ